MKRVLLDDREKRLDKKEKALKEYGERLDGISSELNAYYQNEILPAFERINEREKELSKREEEIKKKEADLPEKIAQYHAYIEESQDYIKKQQEYIQYLTHDISELEARKLQSKKQHVLKPPPTALKKKLMPPHSARVS